MVEYCVLYEYVYGVSVIKYIVLYILLWRCIYILPVLYVYRTKALHPVLYVKDHKLPYVSMLMFYCVHEILPLKVQNFFSKGRGVTGYGWLITAKFQILYNRRLLFPSE